MACEHPECQLSDNELRCVDREWNESFSLAWAGYGIGTTEDWGARMFSWALSRGLYQPREWGLAVACDPRGWQRWRGDKFTKDAWVESLKRVGGRRLSRGRP